jgi:hypothetical protein
VILASADDRGVVEALLHATWLLVIASGWLGYRFRKPPDWHYEISSRHGLSADEVASSRRAVLRGQPIADPRLRAATADWARTVLDDRARARRDHRLQWYLARSLGLLAALVALAGLVVTLLLGGGHDVVLEVYFAVIAVGLLLAPWTRGRLDARIRRAAELNTDPAPPSADVLSQ